VSVVPSNDTPEFTGLTDHVTEPACAEFVIDTDPTLIDVIDPFVTANDVVG
jgi:hypothetical protein